jgi:hypothetical protein
VLLRVRKEERQEVQLDSKGPSQVKQEGWQDSQRDVVVLPKRPIGQCLVQMLREETRYVEL